MDVFDRASELETMHRDAALSRIERYQGESAHHCHECGAEIPEARRKARPGCTRCVKCQEKVDGA